MLAPMALTVFRQALTDDEASPSFGRLAWGAAAAGSAAASNAMAIEADKFLIMVIFLKRELV
jgi:hypothetical protein